VRERERLAEREYDLLRRGEPDREDLGELEFR
jgi:hypothetical protein